MFDKLKKLLASTLIKIGLKPAPSVEVLDPYRNSTEASAHYEITAERVSMEAVMRKTDEVIMISNMTDPGGRLDTDMIDSSSSIIQRVTGVPAGLRKAVSEDFNRTMSELDNKQSA